MHPSVAFTVDDTREWGLPLAGPGLLVEIPREGRWARRPSLHFEAAQDYRLRANSGGQPLLWLRIDSWWDRCGCLRGPAGVPWRLPPLSAAEVREVTHAPDSPLWWEAWVWRMGRAISRPEHPLLHAGRWCLRPVRAIQASSQHRYPISTMEWGFGQLPSAPHSLEGVQRFERFWVEDWTEMFQGAVVPLRAPSSQEDGRVKSWRKRARDGTLPPALLLYVDLLAKWLVIDGHDRIHAALLEGAPAPLLGLWPVYEEVRSLTPAGEQGVLQAAEFHLRGGETPGVIDRVNRMLLLNFQTRQRGTVTRAWPLKGGLPAWIEEVLAWRRSRPFFADAQEWDWFVSRT